MPLPRTIGTGRALLLGGFAATIGGGGGGGTSDMAALEPDSQPNLLLWLDASQITPVADGALISSWTDVSGNARHATQATAGKQPTYRTNVWNGKPTVRFAGDDGLSTGTVDLTSFQQLTIYMVVSAQDQTQQMLCEISDNTGSQSTAAGAYLFADAWSRLEVADKGTTGWNSWKTNNTFEGGTNVPRVIHGMYDMTTLWRHETQGGMDGDTTGERDATNFVNNTGFFGNHPINVGCRAAAGTSSLFLTGDVAEVIVYSGRHPVNVRWGIERRLAEKWGVTAWSKPLANLVFEGDSITEGGNTYFANSYPQRLVNRLKDKVAWLNPAVSGQTLDQIEADAATQIQPESARTYFGATNIATLWAGTNDMTAIGGNQSGASTATQFLNHAAVMQGWGYEVLGFTALPRSDTPNAPADFEAQRGTFNTNVRAGEGNQYQHLVDVAADTTIGDAGDELNTTYYDADKIHPNATGLRYLSGIVGAELAASYGVEQIVPSDLAGLQLWLDATTIAGTDNFPISQWNDLSGNAKHATQGTAGNRPLLKVGILNGKQVVRFDGVNDSLTTAAIDLSATAAITVIAVFNSTTAGTDQVVIEMSDNYNSQTDSFILFRNASNVGQIGARGNNVTNGQTDFAASTGIAATHVCLAAVIDKGKATREATAWRNGVDAGTRGNNNNNTNTFGNRACFIGARNQASLFLAGDIAELMLFSRALTGGERGRLEEYLAYKWGVF